MTQERPRRFPSDAEIFLRFMDEEGIDNIAREEGVSYQVIADIIKRYICDKRCGED